MSAESRQTDERGFTLVELLLVIVIIGILAGVVILAVGGQTKNAAVNSCKTDAKSVETALEEYKAQNNGSYPGANVTNPVGPTSPSDLNTSTGWGALLTATSVAGSPFMTAEPATTHYTIWWTVSTSNVLTVNVAGPDPTNAAYSTLTSPAPGSFDGTNGAICTTDASS